MSEGGEQNPADDTPEYLYSVTLRIKHPAETLEIISKELDLQPDYKWQVGQPRRAPNGTPLPGGGLHKDTYWACSERVSGRRHFFETVAEFLSDLEAAQAFVASLIASGGQISIVVHLPGFRNIGDVISAEDLRRIARLGVELGVEIFPEMN